MNKNKLIVKKSCSAGVIVACCFGIVGFTLTALGFASAALIFNQYADFILLPLFGFFIWSLIFELKKMKNQIWFYLISILGLGLTIFFSLKPINFVFILLGVIGNYLYAKYYQKKC